MDIKNITLDAAIAMCPSIKPQVTNFSHFYIPPNLDGSNGEYELPPNTELYAYGDIHGDFGLLETLLLNVSKVVVKNVDGTYDWARPNCWVVLVGDMVDRDRGGIHTFKKDVNIVHGSQVRITSQGLGEGEDDVGQIQDLLNCLTLKGHTEGTNNKIIKVIGNHDIAITTAVDDKYYTGFTSPYAKDMYIRYLRTLPRTEQLKYSPSYREYCYTELAQKLIGGNAHLICRVGRWVFVHGGLVDRVIDGIKRVCVDTNMLGKKPDGSALHTHDYIAKLNLFYLEMASKQLPKTHTALENAQNDCYKYLSVDDNSPMYARDPGFAGDRELLKYLPQDPMYRDKWQIKHVCSNVEDSLNRLLNIVGSDNHLVVAHCIQNLGKYHRYPESHGKIYEFRANNPISASDDDRIVYASPGKAMDNNLKGINYICPSTNPLEGGKIWRIDCGMSRAFYSLEKFNNYAHPQLGKKDRYDAFRSCRPQCLMIQNNPEEHGKYLTYVLLSKQGLDATDLLSALPPKIAHLYVKHDDPDKINLLNHLDTYEKQLPIIDDPYFGLPKLDEYEYIPPPAPLNNNNRRPRDISAKPMNTNLQNTAVSIINTFPRNNTPMHAELTSGAKGNIKSTFNLTKKHNTPTNKNNKHTKNKNKNNFAKPMNTGVAVKRKGPPNNSNSGNEGGQKPIPRSFKP